MISQQQRQERSAKRKSSFDKAAASLLPSSAKTLHSECKRLLGHLTDSSVPTLELKAHDETQHCKAKKVE